MSRTSPTQTGGTARIASTERGAFVRRAYFHLALAVVAFASLESYIVSEFGLEIFNYTMFAEWAWVLVLALFFAVSLFAERWAAGTTSLFTQYLGLVLYIVASALILAPLTFLLIISAPPATPAAMVFALLAFAALTAVAAVTGREFSVLRGFLVIAVFTGLAVLMAATVFMLNLWIISAALLLGAAMFIIIFSTTRVKNHFADDQYVAASVSLFASLPLLGLRVVQTAKLLLAGRS